MQSSFFRFISTPTWSSLVSCHGPCDSGSLVLGSWPLHGSIPMHALHVLGSLHGPWVLLLDSWSLALGRTCITVLQMHGGEKKPLYTFNSHAFWFVNSEISAMSHWMPCIQLNWTFDWHGAAQDFAYFAFTYRTIYAWLLPLYIWWSSGLLLALWKRARWRATRLPVDGASFHPTMTQLARQSGPAESNKKLLHGGNSRS